LTGITANDDPKLGRVPGAGMTYTSSSNMIDLDGPLIQIFLGFLLAIIGCVLMISSPEYAEVSYLLFLIAGALVALSMIFLASA
jgi:hypothetical protein